LTNSGQLSFTILFSTKFESLMSDSEPFSGVWKFDDANFLEDAER
jgi:hypothetical protein